MEKHLGILTCMLRASVDTGLAPDSGIKKSQGCIITGRVRGEMARVGYCYPPTDVGAKTPWARRRTQKQKRVGFEGLDFEQDATKSTHLGNCTNRRVSVGWCVGLFSRC